jgi:hypothetical protein
MVSTRPWLLHTEAASYLNISRTTFWRLNQKLPCPHGGPETCPRYHAAVLDSWFKKVSKADKNGN